MRGEYGDVVLGLLIRSAWRKSVGAGRGYSGATKEF
jgi:hypothetical protein